MAKRIQIGGRIESKEVGGIVTGAAEILDDAKEKKQSVINQETEDELVRLDQSKQDNLTFDNAPTESSENPVKSGGVYAADKALSDAIEAILLLIPSAASALNKLVDTATMNSSISTATATFRGTYNVVTDLSLTVDATHEQIAAALGNAISTADNNDYAFVQIPVSAESTDIRRTERYKFNGTAWGYEYDLNTSGFTAAQWGAINSGITLALVGKLIGLPTSAELQALLGQKQDTLTFDNVPTAGSANPVKSGGVHTAINDEKTAREQLAQTVTGIDGRVGDVEEVIPTGASANNKLVANNSMEAYVTSIIEAITASFTIATADGHINLTLTQTNGRVASLTLTSSDIASAQALTALTGRVSTNETDIANLQQLYNNLQQSQPVPVTALPATGETGKIYRLAGTNSYSDYMYAEGALTTPIKMAEYDNAIDDVPTIDSDNLVKSGGVYEEFNETTHTTIRDNTLTPVLNYYFYDKRKADCGLTYNSSYRYTDLLAITDFSYIKVNFVADGSICFPVFNGDSLIGYIDTTGEHNVKEEYPTATKIGFCYNPDNADSYTLTYSYNKFDVLNESVNVLGEETDKINRYAFTLYNDNEYSEFTTMMSKAIKSLFLPYIQNNGYKLCVVARNNTAQQGQAKYQLKFYEDNLSGGVYLKGFQFVSNDYSEPDSKYSLIELSTFGYTESLNGYAIIDWSEIPNDTFSTSHTTDNDRINEKFILSSIPTIKESVKWNLPNSMDVPSDFDFWYYENSLISNYDVLFSKEPYIVNVVTDCSNRNIRDGFGNIICDGSYIRFNLILKNTDGTEKTVSTHTITLNPKTKLTNSTKNVIFIGDSYVDNTYGTRGMIGWINYFADQDNNTLVSKGIRTNEYGYHTEAYQGWNESQFLRYVPTAQRASDAPNTRQPGNVVNSPFMFSEDDTVENAVFNFSKYITDFNIGNVDTIVFFLGMNGGNGSGINKMIFGGDSVVVSSIRDVLPSAKIIICMVPPYFGHDNYPIQTKNSNENGRISQNCSYVSLFENKADISICPANGYHRIYGYRTIANGLTMFKFTNGELIGDAELPKGISTYDHHPSTNGIQQLAYNIYKMIYCQ